MSFGKAGTCRDSREKLSHRTDVIEPAFGAPQQLATEVVTFGKVFVQLEGAVASSGGPVVPIALRLPRERETCISVREADPSQCEIRVCVPSLFEELDGGIRFR